MTRKVAINNCHGGFGLSLKAIEALAKLKGFGEVHHYSMSYEDRIYRKHSAEDAKYTKKYSGLNQYTFTENVGDSFTEEDVNDLFDKYILKLEYERDDKDLIKVIEVLGREADGPFSRLEIVEIPKDVNYQIEDYDGSEWVAETHRTWG